MREYLIPIILVLIVSGFAFAQKQQFSYIGNAGEFCVQVPPNYGCEGPDPIIRNENSPKDKSLVLENHQWQGEIKWNNGLDGDAYIRSFGRASLRCENSDCSDHKGRIRGDFTITSDNGGLIVASYTGEISDGTLIGTYRISESQGSLSPASGKGRFILSSGGGFIGSS